MTVPYYTDEQVTLYLGDMREILPALNLQADLVCTDPPYGETSLTWDRWVDGWPGIAATVAKSLWCFGSMRMFLDRRDDFAGAGWKLSQDVVGHDEDGEPVIGDVTVVWEKHNGSGFQNDRFKRVHEHVAHWYLDDWRDQHREVPTTQDATARTVRTKGRPVHMGDLKRTAYTVEDGGPRLMRSVIRVRSMHGRALHPTKKPLGILDPLIRYACPPGGLVVDPFAGSGSTLDAARQCGRRAVGIEADERYAEAAKARLAQLTLEVS